MGNGFLTDIGKTALIFALVYACACLYGCIKAKRTASTRRAGGDKTGSFGGALGEIKKMFSSQLSLGLACVAGILSLALVDSLPAILTIGGMFMGLFYLIFSKRP